MEYLFLLSRVLFGGFFILSGINHFRNVNALAGYAQSKKVPMPKYSVLLTGALLLLGGLGILLGVYIKLAVAFLIIFLVPVTFKMHDYWNETDPSHRMNNKINFQKNIALAGGALAYLFISTPWMFTL